MDRREAPTVPSCSSSSSTERASRASSRRTERRFRRSMSTCVRCYNHGIVDQIKDQDHFCSFRACKCDKCTRYSEYRSALPAESDVKEKRVRRKRHLAQEKKASGPAPVQAQSQAQKASTGAGGAVKVPAGKSPRGSADRSVPKFNASAPEVIRLEDATKSFSFHEVPRAFGHFMRDLRASDPDFDALEWERKLMAAEALLTLKHSSRNRAAAQAQPRVESAHAQRPDGKPQRN